MPFSAPAGAADGLDQRHAPAGLELERAGLLEHAVAGEALHDPLDRAPGAERLAAADAFERLLLLQQQRLAGLVGERELDPVESTEWHPVQKGISERKLKANEIVPVDIELYPSSTIFSAGETLQLITASDEIIPSPPYSKSAECNHGRHVLHFGGTNTMCQCTKGTMSRSMGVTTDNCHTRQGRTLLRSNNMNNSLANIIHFKFSDAKVGTVLI